MFQAVIQSTVLRKVSNKLSAKITHNILSRHISINYKNNVGGYDKLYSTRYINSKNNLLFHVPLNLYSSQVDYMNLENLTLVEFEKISDTTLESLTEYFEDVIEEATHLEDSDVSYGDGVLTAKFGNPYGTYVINRQTPNRQIWLSSPTSGPKRYDFVKGKWVYKYDDKTLHELLNDEISSIVKKKVCFDKCSYSGKE
ncbi:frataxin homolog, mitochondrial-like isoform X2 [Vespa mandarinia]|uniref:frataxin homolog, mitochondrial-like isoform X2 n=1 Tax=Vespa mandarinia TaxID=7446 RepID=UPI00162205A1|nr:frataxin homolog, mitochondrial-like isoform X2 [Vespa mandarinia]